MSFHPVTTSEASRVMTLRLPFLFLLAVSVFSTCSWGPLQAQQGGNIVVESREVLGPVNRLVFGHNIEAGDNARIFSSDTTDLDLIQQGGGFWDPARAAPVPFVLNQSKA